MEREKKKTSGGEKEQPLNSLEEFIQHQQLVDWPVAFEEHEETSAEFFTFTNSEQIYGFLKEQVPFPTHVSESLLEQFEELWARVRAHEARLSHTRSEDPAEEAVDG